ncbi:hypothetical protein [Embleya sp. AB8]|uniref:hypothetical protein n=1 Tax=Embleya sp. AB8 TaxID=3156304 RepID=UPI003C772D26
MIECSRADLPQHRAALVDLLLHLHDRAEVGSRYGAFRIVSAAGRPWAVSEFGARYYEEGVPVHLIVGLSTGAHVTVTAHRVSATRPDAMDAFFDPDPIPPTDPIRQWLAQPADRPDPTPISVDRPDLLERFAAADLVRRDHPHLAPERSPTPAPTFPHHPYAEIVAATPGHSIAGEVLFGRTVAGVPTAFRNN